jgi:hypothetical protein
MRKTLLSVRLLTLLLVVLLAASCKKKEKDKPEVATESQVEDAEETTEEFFEALEDNDLEKAQTLVTPETRPVLDVVIKDARRHEEKHGEKPKIKVVILERKPLVERVDLKVQITVGEKVRKETLKLVLVEDDWRIVLPRKQLALVRLVVFHEPFKIILVDHKVEEHHHHDDDGCKHHKHKHKHKHHGHDDDH